MGLDAYERRSIAPAPADLEAHQDERGGRASAARPLASPLRSLPYGQLAAQDCVEAPAPKTPSHSERSPAPIEPVPSKSERAHASPLPKSPNVAAFDLDDSVRERCVASDAAAPLLPPRRRDCS
jgi:hypothetical protein